MSAVRARQHPPALTRWLSVSWLSSSDSLPLTHRVKTNGCCSVSNLSICRVAGRLVGRLTLSPVAQSRRKEFASALPCAIMAVVVAGHAEIFGSLATLKKFFYCNSKVLWSLGVSLPLHYGTGANNSSPFFRSIVQSISDLQLCFSTAFAITSGSSRSFSR